jgi:hypothetical protein
MLSLLVRLLGDEDSEVAETARLSLESIPATTLLPALRAADCPAEVLEHFSGPATPAALMEAVVLNTATPGPVIAALASHAPAATLDAITLNRVRLLENPGILESIRRNPALTPEVERVVQEIEQEFFSSKKHRYTVGTAEAPESAEEPPAEELEELTLEELMLEGLPVEEAAREKALIDRLASMPVPKKLRYASLGNREVRGFLIRDSNKQVARAVLKNPRLSDSEVESFAKMRNVAEEVLRDIAVSREWTRPYGVVHALVLNPKTPAAMSQRLMSRLTTRDLANVARDRGVSDLVRRSAQQTVALRSRSQGGA